MQKQINKMGTIKHSFSICVYAYQQWRHKRYSSNNLSQAGFTILRNRVLMFFLAILKLKRTEMYLAQITARALCLRVRLTLSAS